MPYFIIICMSLVILVLLYLLYTERKRTNNTLIKIEKMLDRASKKENVLVEYDESFLSFIELKFRDFLLSHRISEESLKLEKQKVEMLVSDISHQVKTPLSNIILYTSLLKENNVSEEDKLYLENIEKQSKKLDFLIKSLFKISYLENGIFELNIREHSVKKLIEEVTTQHIERIKSKNMNLELEIIDESAMFDIKWTIEALSNIVDNSIKYGNDNGKIIIKVVSYELFVRIDVIDDGKGIAEAEKEKVFSRFYRSKDVHDSEGLGIGLYLAREIVNLEGGYIKLDTSQENGVMFSVFLPKR